VEKEAAHEEPEMWEYRPLQELWHTMRKGKEKKHLDDGKNLD
jgi:hypothetical protein